MNKITRWELVAVAAMTLGYLVSFRSSSPLNGPHEVFGQDSTYIVRSIVGGTPYRYNPQHHLLYHALTEWGWALLTRWWSPNKRLAYGYLKVFSALTGTAFLLTLLPLLRAMRLSPPRRLVLLVLAGFSVTAWFNFAGFETHSLALWAFNVFLLCALRLVRDRELRRADAVCLAAALAFAALARMDDARLLLVASLLLLAPSLRRLRGRLAAALCLSAALTCVGYLVVGSAYFGIPIRAVPHQLATRADRADLRPKLARRSNLDGHFLTVMGRATSVYTVMMPPGKATFGSPLGPMLAHPLSAAALAGMLALWTRLLVPVGRSLWRGDLFVWLVAVSWVPAFLFFTWLNPREPFLWLLEFLPLLVALAAHALKRAGRPTWIFLALLAMVTVLHNWVDFYCRYDL